MVLLVVADVGDVTQTDRHEGQRAIFSPRGYNTSTSNRVQVEPWHLELVGTAIFRNICIRPREGPSIKGSYQVCRPTEVLSSRRHGAVRQCIAQMAVADIFRDDEGVMMWWQTSHPNPDVASSNWSRSIRCPPKSYVLPPTMLSFSPNFIATTP